MAKSGGQPGNDNGSKNKPWREAIEKELTGNANAKKLRGIAKALIEQANDGNMQAIKELGDRLDGKAAQSTEITGKDGGDIPIRHIIDYQDADE